MTLIQYGNGQTQNIETAAELVCIYINNRGLSCIALDEKSILILNEDSRIDDCLIMGIVERSSDNPNILNITEYSERYYLMIVDDNCGGEGFIDHDELLRAIRSTRSNMIRKLIKKSKGFFKDAIGVSTFELTERILHVHGMADTKYMDCFHFTITSSEEPNKKAIKECFDEIISNISKLPVHNTMAMHSYKSENVKLTVSFILNNEITYQQYMDMVSVMRGAE